MKGRIYFIVKILLCFMVIFTVGKVIFMTYNHTVDNFSIGDVLEVLLHGFTMDLSTSGYLLIVPWLCCLLSFWIPRFAFRKVLRPYCIVVAAILALVIGADVVLYEHWKFKINFAIFSYMASPQNAANSVSIAFIVICVALAVALISALAATLIKLTPRLLNDVYNRLNASLLWLLAGGVIFLMIRGGIGASVMNVGKAYYSQRLFLNHAAVNPAFSLVSSANFSSCFADEFHLIDDAKCDSIFQGLYPGNLNDITDTLLCNQRPQVLIVTMESFGASFVENLGGEKNVAVNIERLIPEGIFWTNYYSNSFRTDRGTVSLNGGYISYPTASLMRLPDKLQYLPGIANSLKEAGYSTHYIYGGDIEVMGKSRYLSSAGYDHLISSNDFSKKDVVSSKWGVNDSITAERAYRLIAEGKLGKQWLLNLQTINSHEPFEVPYHRLDDKVLNAFAYTDECVGRLIRRLKKLPVWDNLLIILVPDHGYLYNITYEDMRFFHSPMLWLGGAIKEPRSIDVIMNQSDLCATLLAQMGLSHAGYEWSRNVLSANYTYPFAYCSWPSGIVFVDSTGHSVYDITSHLPIAESPAPCAQRIDRAKAILQKSYYKLDKLH